MKTDDSPGVFLRSLEWRIAEELVESFHGGMYVRLGGGLLARIRIGYGVSSSDRDRLDVTIINRERGTVDSLEFLFDAHLPADARKDGRRDYTSGFRIKENQGWGWYIAVPTDTRPLCAAVERWINLFCK